MNSNCDTFIKEEFLTAKEQLNIIPGNDLNILVKNEPITDEPSSSVTIKTEPLVDTACLIETVSIKTENSLQNQKVVPENSFVIYELERQIEKTNKEISKELSRSTSQAQIENSIQATRKVLQNTETISNLNENTLINTRSSDGIATKVAGTPPILLNDKLRKRHKVIISAKPADKRKRYNIQGTPSATILEKSNSVTVSRCRLLNSENKKIINHLIKSKQKEKQQQSEKNCDLSKSTAIIRNNKSPNMEQNFVVECEEQLEQQTTTAIQTQPETLTPISITLPLPVIKHVLNTPKPLAESTIIPELRVKCLCSLTGDTTAGDNSELTAFFEEMFMQTKCLNKTQQRKVKMSLLKAICDAEDLVEQGKCCEF